MTVSRRPRKNEYEIQHSYKFLLLVFQKTKKLRTKKAKDSDLKKMSFVFEKNEKLN